MCVYVCVRVCVCVCMCAAVHGLPSFVRAVPESVVHRLHGLIYGEVVIVNSNDVVYVMRGREKENTVHQNLVVIGL